MCPNGPNPPVCRFNSSADMSRNSSGRSSYSYKSQEDFQDEILDLKRQLARLKEESRTLKVKLRRSEENAARKEKIICNMIDPLKAHLSAKSIKCPQKGSQKKEVQNSCKSTSVINAYHHSSCSRAYRHTSKSHEVLNRDHSRNCTEELNKCERKKKYPSKVSVCESISEPHGELPSAVFSVRPLAVKDCRIGDDGSPIGIKKCGVSIKPFANFPKNKEEIFVSPAKSPNPKKGRINKKNTKGKTKKKKSEIDNNARSLLFQLCASSENEEDSYSSYVAVDTSKSQGNAEVNHSALLTADSIPHNSDNCKRCHLKSRKSIDHVNDNVVTQEIENLIKGGKNLLSLWNEDNEVNAKHLNTQGNYDHTCGERNAGEHSLSKEHSSNKFGMYLINEHDEVEDSGCADIIVAEDESETLESWREVDSKVNPSCFIGRRASIFRVDIKKKDLNTGSECFENVSGRDTDEVIHGRSCCKASKESSFYETGNESMRLHEVSVDTDCQVMKTLLEAMAVTDDSSRKNEERMNPNRGKCLRNTLENLLAVTEVDCMGKPAMCVDKFQERTNAKELLCKSKRSNVCLTGNLSRKFDYIYSNADTILLHGDTISHQSSMMNLYDHGALLDVTSFPWENPLMIPAILKRT